MILIMPDEALQVATRTGDALAWHALADFREERGLPAFRPHSAGRDTYAPWVSFRVVDVVQRMRWIPPGQFWMGSPYDEEGRYPDEGPRHLVTIRQGYWLFDTPVTQELWQAVVGDNPSQFKGPRRPVEGVSWHECQPFLERLNTLVPGLTLSLPSEAQWEYACRADTHGARYGDLDAIAWYAENSDRQTHPVGEKEPNPWGLYDLLGNVWEWCSDGSRDYTAEAVTDPLGPTDPGAHRVIRGGYCFGDARPARAAQRFAIHPGNRIDYVGFRCSSSFLPLIGGMHHDG